MDLKYLFLAALNLMGPIMCCNCLAAVLVTCESKPVACVQFIIYHTVVCATILLLIMMCFPSGQEKVLKFYDFLPYTHRPFVSTQEDEAFSSADLNEVTTEQ